MRLATVPCILAIVLFLVMTPEIDAKRKKNKSAESAKSKTKTKWSSETVTPDGSNQLLSTEEHGYYVKRTFVAADGTLRSNVNGSVSAPKGFPYLAVPFAWFPCAEGDACRKDYSAAFNSGLNALSEGFLCSDNCEGPYEPICGKTSTEIALFYNKCKLNVAKCRTHGYWTDFAYDECLKAYPKEVEQAEQEFKKSPYFHGPKKEIEEDKTMTPLAEVLHIPIQNNESIISTDENNKSNNNKNFNKN